VASRVLGAAEDLKIKFMLVFSLLCNVYTPSGRWEGQNQLLPEGKRPALSVVRGVKLKKNFNIFILKLSVALEFRRYGEFHRNGITVIRNQAQTYEPRDVPQCGALSLLQKPLHHRGFRRICARVKTRSSGWCVAIGILRADAECRKAPSSQARRHKSAPGRAAEGPRRGIVPQPQVS